MRHRMPLVALAVLLVAGQADAFVSIDADTTIDYVISDAVSIVDGPNPPTVVTIVDLAYLDLEVQLFNASILNVRGGRITDDVVAWASSCVNVWGGEVGYEDNLEARGSSTVNVYGGRIGDTVMAFDFGTVNFAGGSLSEDIVAHGTSTVTVSGGQGDDLWAYDSSTINVLGGGFNSSLSAFDASTVNVSGGGPLHRIHAGQTTGYHTSVIRIHGTGFNYPYGEVPDSSGTLTGLLANGDPLTVLFDVYSDASIVLVPEPATFFLLAAGGLILRRRRPG